MLTLAFELLFTLKYILNKLNFIILYKGFIQRFREFIYKKSSLTIYNFKDKDSYG